MRDTSKVWRSWLLGNLLNAANVSAKPHNCGGTALCLNMGCRWAEQVIALQEKVWMVLVSNRLNMSQQCVLSAVKSYSILVS